MTRIVITPDKVPEPPTEDNLRDMYDVYRFPYELMSGSGNIHILDTGMIEDIAELINGNVMVRYKDNDKDIIENASISSIRP